MPSSIYEERHFYNRSYITVNTSPKDDYSPFPYTNYATVPKYSSKIDDYAQRFTNSKASPTPLSDDGYMSSSASSTFASFNPRRERSNDDFDRSNSRLSTNTNLSSDNKPTRMDWANIQIISTKDEPKPVEILKNDNNLNKFQQQQPTVKFITENDNHQNSGFDDKKYKNPSTNSSVNVDGKALKNVRMTIAEIEEREKQEKEKASMIPDINVQPATPLPEDKLRATDGIIRLQSGTNQHESQKGMTSFGTSRRETTKVSSNDDNFNPEHPDQSEIPLQSGTNKFASQKGMTSFGTMRRERTKINDPSFDPEHPDQSEIRLQSGTNKFASQKGMTGFGQPRWEVLNQEISQSDDPQSNNIIRLQSGSNKFASQSGLTSFGTMRDPHGKHLKRLWEQYYPDNNKSNTL